MSLIEPKNIEQKHRTTNIDVRPRYEALRLAVLNGFQNANLGEEEVIAPDDVIWVNIQVF